MTPTSKTTSAVPLAPHPLPPNAKPPAPSRPFAALLAKPKSPAIAVPPGGPKMPMTKAPTAPATTAHGPATHIARKPTREREREKNDARKPDEGQPTAMLLDPMTRTLSAQAPFTAPAATPSAPIPAPAMDELIHRFLKRFAMSGDRTQGTAHLDLAHGELAGGSITLTAERGHVRINVQGPPGVDTTAFEAALEKRLADRGLSVAVT